MKGDLKVDDRGLIREAYRIEGIGLQDCRTIFLDWVIGLPEGTDSGTAIGEVLEHYRDDHPEHPMTAVLEEGQNEGTPPRRKGGRSGRKTE